MTGVFEFLSQSVFMIPLALCSVVALAVAIHRAFCLRTSAVMPAALVTALEEPEANAHLDDLILHPPSALGKVAGTAVLDRHPDAEAATRATESRAREEVMKLQGGLTTLEVIITIAPLLGLLGTVSGLVTVFSGIGTGAGEQAAPTTGNIARGISEALNTTIAGLVVAVPTVIAHGYFGRRIEAFAARMEVLLQRAIGKLYHDDGEPEEDDIPF